MRRHVLLFKVTSDWFKLFLNGPAGAAFVDGSLSFEDGAGPQWELHPGLVYMHRTDHSEIRGRVQLDSPNQTAAIRTERGGVGTLDIRPWNGPQSVEIWFHSEGPPDGAYGEHPRNVQVEWIQY